MTTTSTLTTTMTDAGDTRRTVSPSQETELALGAHPDTPGLSENDLSKFIQEAVHWRSADLAARGARAADANVSWGELQLAIDEACAAASADMRRSIDADCR